MANKIADARRSLVRAKESANERLKEIEKERQEIKVSVKALDAALKALEKTSRTKQPQQPTQTESFPNDNETDAT